jgi:hypothetical protein
VANHGWTWQREPVQRPQRCAVFPHIQQGAYIDTGMNINTYDPHVYIGETAARELGKMVGMVPRSDLDQARIALDEARATIVEKQREVEQLQAFKDAVELIQAA